MKISWGTNPDSELEQAVIFKDSLPERNCDICFTAIVDKRGTYASGEAYIDFRPSVGWKATVKMDEKVLVQWPPGSGFLVRVYVSRTEVLFGSMDVLTLAEWTGYSESSGGSYDCLLLSDKKYPSYPVANFHTAELIITDATKATLYRIGTIKGKGEDYAFDEGESFVLRNYNDKLTVWDGMIKNCHEKGACIEVTIKSRE
ncbi:hypothetical protein HX776_20150 [Pseudomonas agarici]|uniref:hypothetical protein n=1 Tax=Pseudomonas agarici TaxID=46677 RepID=UPI00115FFE1F|nr:hypothetical protein [Pseudomonas agarici]NWC11109.1 hypothetical protein [Pseudomonas agarici]